MVQGPERLLHAAMGCVMKNPRITASHLSACCKSLSAPFNCCSSTLAAALRDKTLTNCCCSLASAGLLPAAPAAGVTALCCSYSANCCCVDDAFALAFGEAPSRTVSAAKATISSQPLTATAVADGGSSPASSSWSASGAPAASDSLACVADSSCNAVVQSVSQSVAAPSAKWHAALFDQRDGWLGSSSMARV